MFHTQLIDDLESTGLFNAIGDPISVQDTDFRVIYQNKRHVELVGDKHGEYCYNAYKQRDRVCENCHLSLCFQDGKIHTLEQAGVPASGISYAEITGSPLRDASGKIIAGIEIIRDISARKIAENDLVEAIRKIEDEKAKTESILETIGDHLSIQDTNLKIIYQNKISRDTFGDHAGEFCYKAYHGRDTECVECHIAKCFKDGQIHRLERAAPRNGDIMYTEHTASPLRDSTGSIIAGIEIVRDISGRKCLEEALKKTNEMLEARVKERTFDLVKANDILLEEISERKRIEQELRETDHKLTIHSRELEESNTALKVLLRQREQDQKEFENNILSNMKHLIFPYLDKLKENRTMSEELVYLNLLESNLKEIVSPFSSKLSFKFLDFTPREILIANLIKDGRQDKDIMNILNISLETVKSHRQNIRKKLGIYGIRTNLRTKLMSLT